MHRGHLYIAKLETIVNTHGLFKDERSFHALIPLGQRRLDLDVLRGIAIIGILFLNAPFFVYFDYGYIAIIPENNLDQCLQAIQVLLLDGRFRGMFLVLFTIGLVAQWHRYSNSGNDAQGILSRRLKVLLGFGVVHGFFIWAGDILLGYAIAGLIALPMLSKQISDLKHRGYTFCAVGAILLIGFGALSNAPEVTYESATHQTFLSQFNSDFFASRANNAVNATLMVVALFIGVLWLELGIILLSAAAWRSGWLSARWKRKDLVTMASVLLLCALASAWQLQVKTDFTAIVGLVSSSISGAITAIIALHLLCVFSLPNNALFRALAGVGKMSLSCYLLQSLVMVTLVHFYGDVFVNSFYLIDYVCMSLFISAFLVLFCNAYLRIFKLGPAESLWRFASSRLKIE